MGVRVCEYRRHYCSERARRKLAKEKYKECQENERRVGEYTNKLLEERRIEEKMCKSNSRDLKKKASLFVARRLHAIIAQREENLRKMNEEI